jgi:glutamine amidotransferase
VRKLIVVDYGLGNILSVVRAFEHLGCEVHQTTNPLELKLAGHIVLPGVGAFSTAATRLERLGFKEALLEAGSAGKSILGICLGMQLLFTTGYEHTQTPGIGLLEGEVVKMEVPRPEGEGSMTLPEVGWRKVVEPSIYEPPHCSIFSKTTGCYFYFVHSYEAKPLDSTVITGSYIRGQRLVVASVEKNNIFGVQYHPEKSGQSGLDFLRKFLEAD